MKKLLFAILLFWSGSVAAQGEEVTQADDNARQLQYYLQQIAANAVMIKYIKAGINIARFGLNTIYIIKNKEFNLHDLFFKALKLVNPKIKGLGTVAEIIERQARIIKIYKSAYKRMEESGQFTQTELKYALGVFDRLLDDATHTLDELIKVLSSNHYQFSDDERIVRINALYEDMNSSYRFVQRFSHEALAMAVQRLQEKTEVDRSRKLLDIK
ncbi:MAG TPA: hypothetical protein PLR74_11680 [Agriterribacter sp.]|nr:hypothetical protein [Agriterribacter sp.]